MQVLYGIIYGTMYPSEFKTNKRDYARINSQNIFENL